MCAPQEKVIACQQREVMSALGASEHAAAACFAVAAMYACDCRASGDRACAIAKQQAARVTTLQLEAARRDERLVHAREDAAALKEQLRAATQRETKTDVQHAEQVRAVS